MKKPVPMPLPTTTTTTLAEQKDAFTDEGSPPPGKVSLALPVGAPARSRPGRRPPGKPGKPVKR